VVAVVAVATFALRTPSGRIESIAVLPLENLSGDRTQEFFADGMTDQLIGELAHIPYLRVISRTSSMHYKGGARKLLPVIAKELNVDAIVEGTVVQAGGKVRITIQLIRARDDRHLLSEKYERDLTDVLALQGEVARDIADRVHIQLTPRHEERLARMKQVNPEAHVALLEGNFFLHQGIRGVGKSIESFTRATHLDPSLADAHAGLAEALIFAGIFGIRPSAETHPQARRAALKALELDDSNAAAHTALGDVIKGYDWDLAGAEAEFRRAIQLNPSDLLTRLWYADCLARMNRYEEALAESRRAIALDPVSPISHNNRAMLLWRARRFDEAIRSSKDALALEPNFVNALWWQGLSYAAKRQFSEAIASLTKAAGMSRGPLFQALLAHVYGRAGEGDKARSILDGLYREAKQSYVSPVDFAVVYAGLGEVDAAFEWLEKAYQSRTTRIHELPLAYFDSIRSDARYAELVRRVGLPAEAIGGRVGR
jgi:TolB-like protein/Tfp pilus assembly protein PilF